MRQLFTILTALFILTAFPAQGQTGCDTLAADLIKKLDSYSQKQFDKLKKQKELGLFSVFNIGTYFRLKGDTSCKEWYRRCVTVSYDQYMRTHDKNFNSCILFDIGVSYYYLGDLQKAQMYLLKSKKAKCEGRCVDDYYAKTMKDVDKQPKPPKPEINLKGFWYFTRMGPSDSTPVSLTNLKDYHNLPIKDNDTLQFSDSTTLIVNYTQKYTYKLEFKWPDPGSDDYRRWEPYLVVDNKEYWLYTYSGNWAIALGHRIGDRGWNGRFEKRDSYNVYRAKHYKTKESDIAIFPAVYSMQMPLFKWKVKNVSSFFTPTRAEVDTAEFYLKMKIISIDTTHQRGQYIFNHLKKYRRQYFGYIDSSGHKILYINSFWWKEKDIKEMFLTGLQTAAGGGIRWWRIQFDLADKKFFGFRINSNK